MDRDSFRAELNGEQIGRPKTPQICTRFGIEESEQVRTQLRSALIALKAIPVDDGVAGKAMAVESMAEVPA